MRISCINQDKSIGLENYADMLIYDKDNTLIALRMGGYPEMVQAMSEVIQAGCSLQVEEGTTKVEVTSLGKRNYEKKISHDGVYAEAMMYLKDSASHGYIKKHYPKLSREKHDAMWFKNRYPILFGIAKEETCTLKSIRQVARFICRNGVKGDVCIINMHGELFLDTFGLYINKIADNDYLEELKKVLIPMQKRIEKNIFKKA